MNISGPLLALDSSSKCLSFAVGGGGLEIQELETDKDFRHAETIVTHIDLLLKKVHLNVSQLAGVACGIGPGSFTGLRVGLAAVKALMLSKNLPCFTISSLDLIAQNAAHLLGRDVAHVRVLVDARRSRYYTSGYSFNSGAFQKVGTDEIVEAEIIKDSIKEKTALLGDGLLTFPKNYLAEKKDLVFLPGSSWYPRAVEIIKLAALRSSLLAQMSIHEVRPAYLVATEPEERLASGKELRRG